MDRQLRYQDSSFGHLSTAVGFFGAWCAACSSAEATMTLDRTCTVSPSDQLEFARLSADFNPMHLDARVARRLLFGRPVVHGVHGVLWGLSAALKEQGAIALRSLKATFRSPVHVGESLSAVVDRQGDTLRVSLHTERGLATRVTAQLSDPEAWHAAPVPTIPAAGDLLPRDRAWSGLEGDEGVVPLALDSSLAHTLFPGLSELAPLQLASLLATTRIIGMECPGMHSLFHKLSLQFSGAPPDADPELTYGVTELDDRFGRIELAVEGPGVAGILIAYMRPRPTAQPLFASFQHLVAPDTFTDRRALVVGGSRGLGEVAAKLLAVGGARVWLTYCQGEAEALRVVEDIRAGGGEAEALHCDVKAASDLLKQQLATASSATDLVYMATPHIGAGRAGDFDERRFAEFCDVYVTGFARVLGVLTADLRRVIYPSSCFVDEALPTQAEYSAAKAAGELAAAAIVGARDNVVLHAPRLPRLATDQTAALGGDRASPPAPFVLKALRGPR